MPEGHTIHRLARRLNETLGGETVRASSPQGRFEGGAAAIDGNGLISAEAWGKYLFCDFGTGEVLHVHLGLIGKFRTRAFPPEEPTGAVRLRLVGSEHTWDLSGPTRCELLTPDEQDRIVERLGPDPLRRDADPSAARARLARTERPIGATLLDQSIIAGIGNVYRAELLFVCGIHPARPSTTITDTEFEAIWDETVRLLRIGERSGRIVTTDPEEIGRPRSRMRREDRLYVYHREHCRRCGAALRTDRIGGRPITHCPTCQPAKRRPRARARSPRR
ncbi:MAG: Fpg/Nei family DNA glycosylase [Actinobacteria bacterium]|nr:Fpg/Nei family DNA glycosylase [Actinomycetota bacterium]